MRSTTTPTGYFACATARIFRLSPLIVKLAVVAVLFWFMSSESLAYTNLSVDISPEGITGLIPITNEAQSVAFIRDETYLCNGSWGFTPPLTDWNLEANFGCGNPASDGVYDIVFSATSTVGIYYQCYLDAEWANATWQECLDNALYKARFVRAGGIWTASSTNNSLPLSLIDGINSQQKTRFLSLSVTASSTVPKDVHFRMTYFLDPSEINRSVSAFNPTQISLSISKKPATTFDVYSYNISTSTGTSSVDLTLPDASIADNGDFDLLVQFSNQSVPFGGARPFEKSYIYTAFTLTNKAVTATSPIENYNTNFVASTTVARDCGLTDIGGCFVNAFSYLFQPSDESVNAFVATYETVWEKAPFAYAGDIPDVVNEIFPTGTENFSIGADTSIGEVTFLSTEMISSIPLASTLRSIMGYILWLGFAFAVYRKVLSINDNHVAV